MAKKSSIEKNERRKRWASRQAPIRKALREKAVDMKLSEAERYEARVKLQKLPVKSAPIRVRSRCAITGRPRGNFRKFALSRLAFRKMASEGLLPGVTKASW